MKEELIKLRELTDSFSQAKKEYEEKKAEFDEATKSIIVLFPESYENASYEVACKVYENYGCVREYAQKIRREHPRYGEKRFRETLIEMFGTTKGYENFSNGVESIVDAHLAFEKLGFNEVKALEEKQDEAARLLAANVNDVKTDKIDTAVASFNTAVDTAKAYGKVAKKQIGIFGNFAKKTISNGAKQLIKILDKSDDNSDNQ